MCIALFILLFSFSRISSGNCNWLAPYSHELPRGFLLALLSLLSLDTALLRRSAPLVFLSGSLLGLSLFTKPEIALATVSAAAVLFLFWEPGRPAHSSSPPQPSHSSLVSRQSSLFLPFASGLLASLLLVLVPLSLALGSFRQAVRDGLLKLYLDCFNPALTSLPFFKSVMGTNDIPAHTLRLLFGATLAATPFSLARFALPSLSSRPLCVASAALLTLFTAAIGFFAFWSLNAALPLAPVTLLGLLFWERGRPARDEDSKAPPAFVCNGDIPRRPLALAFASFAFFLVSKMLLDASITFYGFVLTLPAFCCSILLFFRPPCSAARAAIAVAILFGFAAKARLLDATTLRHWDVRHPVHDATVRSGPLDARSFNAVLDWIRANTAPDSTLAVLPEGAVLNVLSGRPNPTPYVSFPVTDWPRYDETAVLASYSNSPPDTLVLVRKPQEAIFGTDYAQSLMALLNPLYDPVYAYAIPTPDGPRPYILVSTRIAPAP